MTHYTDWIHQRAVSVDDGGDPEDTVGAIEATGWDAVEFLVQAEGDGGAATLTLAPLWWNPVNETWFTVAGDEMAVGEDGAAHTTVPVRGKFLATRVNGTDNVPAGGYVVLYRFSRESGFSSL